MAITISILAANLINYRTAKIESGWGWRVSLALAGVYGQGQRNVDSSFFFFFQFKIFIFWSFSWRALFYKICDLIDNIL